MGIVASFKKQPLIIRGSVQLNRIYSSVQLWTNGYLADVLKVAGRLTVLRGVSAYNVSGKGQQNVCEI